MIKNRLHRRSRLQHEVHQQRATSENRGATGEEWVWEVFTGTYRKFIRIFPQLTFELYRI